MVRGPCRGQGRPGARLWHVGVAVAVSEGTLSAHGVNITDEWGRSVRAVRGHLEPFGSWRPGLPVEMRTDIPSSQEFYKRYSAADGGAGRPLLLRGAARRMSAMGWSDEYLLRVHGNARVTDVEVGLKETRADGAVSDIQTLRAFLEAYNHSDIHLVSSVPPRMQRELELLPMLRCGGFLNFLGSHKLWIGRGGSRSVVHKDDAENINCLLAGSKRFALVHPRWSREMEAHPNAESPPDRFGFVDVRRDPTQRGPHHPAADRLHAVLQKANITSKLQTHKTPVNNNNTYCTLFRARCQPCQL